MNSDNDYDPNILFGTYCGIIAILLIASIFLGRHYEPEIILHQREKEESLPKQMATPDDGIIVEFESSYDSSLDDTLCESCGRAFRSICRLLAYTEFTMPLVFLFI